MLYRHRVPTLFLALALVAGSTSGCMTTENVVTGERQRAAFTWQQEVQLGQEADQQVRAMFGFYDDTALERYVDELGQLVLSTSAHGTPETPEQREIAASPFTFRVLDSHVVNAMALPGGYIYVTRGLLSHVENEAQLAMILGHEVGHVLGRHASRRQATAQLGQIGLLGAAILGEAVAGAGRAVMDIGGAGAQLLFLRHSREDEREADRAGVAYSEFAGYDAAQAAAFFRTLQRLGEQGGALPGWLSTHPDPAEREATIPQLAAQYDGTLINRDQYLRSIEGIVLGEDPRQGFTEGNRFYHPDLQFVFAYPANWQVVNTPGFVQITQPNNQAAIRLELAQEQSAQAAATAFGRLQGVALTSSRSTRVNNLNAVDASFSLTTQQGTLVGRALFIEHDGRVYSFFGFAPQNAWATHRGTIDSALQSFARLTDPQYLNRQAVRLELVRTTQTGTFQQQLSGRPLPEGMTARDLAVMNQTDVSTQIPAGTTLKLPRRQ